MLIIALAQYLVRIFLIGPSAHWADHLLDPQFFLLTSSTLLIAAAGYIINDYYDVKIDLINKPRRVVVGKVLKRRFAMVAHTVLNMAGIGIGFLLSKEIALVNFVSAFWLWLYSNQLKRRPFIGNFSIAALTAASVYIVAIFFKTNNPMVLVFALFAFFTSLVREILKDMEDLRGDMHHGCKTLPIVLGIRKTKTVIFTIFLFFVGTIFTLSLLINNTAMHIYFLGMSVPSAWFIYEVYWADTKKAYHRLSIYCKIAMVSGLILMIFL